MSNGALKSWARRQTWRNHRRTSREEGRTIGTRMGPRGTRDHVEPRDRVLRERPLRGGGGAASNRETSGVPVVDTDVVGVHVPGLCAVPRLCDARLLGARGCAQRTTTTGQGAMWRTL